MEEYEEQHQTKDTPAHDPPDELTANAVARMTVNNNFMLG